MNERIKEIIRSADVHIIPDESEYGHTVVGMEKFAELIIQECASIYEGVYTDQQRPERIDTRIKEHFGIEEPNNVSNFELAEGV
jgi:hypothetical protein